MSSAGRALPVSTLDVRIGLGVAAALTALLVLVVALPLAVYTTTLACFGIAHVLTELRFIDHRFGASVGRDLRVRLPLLIAGVVSVRVAGVAGVGSYELRLVAELCLVALLVVAVLPVLRRRARSLVAGVALCAAILCGVAVAPLHTLLALAVLHNLTPLGFIAEALRGRERQVALALGAVAFIGLPLLIATGLPHDLLSRAVPAAPDAALLPVGPLAAHLGVYVHPAFHERPWALHAFSGAVFAQCMHYAVVIHVLPRLAGDGAPILPWSSGRHFRAAIIVASIGFLGLFAWRFSDTRALYGVFAAVHAWVEVPILLLALACDDAAPGR